MRNRDPVKESYPRCRVSALPPLRLGSGNLERHVLYGPGPKSQLLKDPRTGHIRANRTFYGPGPRRLWPPMWIGLFLKENTCLQRGQLERSSGLER